MGLFADYRSTVKMSKEIGKRTDVKGSMADMQSKMEALNGSMAQTAQGQAITSGVPCTATVTSVQQTGALINFSPACQIELLVMIPGRPPTPVTRTEAIPPLFMSRALPGCTVRVKVMPDDLDDLFIDWAAA